MVTEAHKCEQLALPRLLRSGVAPSSIVSCNLLIVNRTLYHGPVTYPEGRACTRLGHHSLLVSICTRPQIRRRSALQT